jgi:hypothetical protein
VTLAARHHGLRVLGHLLTHLTLCARSRSEGSDPLPESLDASGDTACNQS